MTITYSLLTTLLQLPHIVLELFQEDIPVNACYTIKPLELLNGVHRISHILAVHSAQSDVTPVVEDLRFYHDRSPFQKYVTTHLFKYVHHKNRPAKTELHMPWIFFFFFNVTNLSVLFWTGTQTVIPHTVLTIMFTHYHIIQQYKFGLDQT